MLILGSLGAEISRGQLHDRAVEFFGLFQLAALKPFVARVRLCDVARSEYQHVRSGGGVVTRIGRVGHADARAVETK